MEADIPLVLALHFRADKARIYFAFGKDFPTSLKFGVHSAQCVFLGSAL
jgi:hypothetical protein